LRIITKKAKYSDKNKIQWQKIKKANKIMKENGNDLSEKSLISQAVYA